MLGLLIALALVGLTLKYNEVDDRITTDDLPVLRHILGGDASPPHEALPNESWPDQRARIARTVQQVMAAAPFRKDIPEGHLREPADVLRNGGGVCYDLSRLIEKALQMQGFRIRHVALYRKQPGKNLMQTLLTRRVISHAVSEVLTNRGWMVVDSVDGWLAQDAQQNPLSIEQLSANAALHASLLPCLRAVRKARHVLPTVQPHPRCELRSVAGQLALSKCALDLGQVGVDYQAFIELCGHFGASAKAHVGSPNCANVNHAPHRVCQAAGAAHLAQVAIAAVVNHLAAPHRIGGDQGPTHCSGLQQGPGRPLPV